MEDLQNPIAEIRELIDTCWDVNIIQCTGGLEEYTELIDTCWDVNNREQIITVIMIAN